MTLAAAFLLLIATSGALADVKSDFAEPIAVAKKLVERNKAAIDAALADVETIEDLDVLGLDTDPILKEFKEKEEAARKENEPFFADTLANPRSIPDACQALHAQHRLPSAKEIVKMCIELHSSEQLMGGNKKMLKFALEKEKEKVEKKMNIDELCGSKDTHWEMAKCLQGARDAVEEIYLTRIIRLQKEVEKSKIFVEEAKKNKVKCLNAFQADKDMWTEFGKFAKIADDMFKKCVEEGVTPAPA